MFHVEGDTCREFHNRTVVCLQNLQEVDLSLGIADSRPSVILVAGQNIIQPKTIDPSTKLQGINSTNSVVIS